MPRPVSPPAFFSLCIAVAWLAGLVTLLGFFGSASWILDLFSHFRFQYLLGFTGLALLLAGLRCYRTLPVCAVGFGINAVVLAPLFFGGAGSPIDSSEAAPLRAMLFNVNTHGDPIAARQAIELAQPDILLLEEISVRWLEALRPLHAAYPYRLTRPRDDNFGIALFSKLPFAESAIVSIGPSAVPSVAATITTPSGPLAFLGTHPLPPISGHYTQSRNDHLAELSRHIDASIPTLLMGDLNITPWHPRFQQIATATGLRDSSRGFGYQPTWPNNTFLFRIPLDHALLSTHLYLHDRSTGPHAGSDHRALILDFSF